MSDLKVVGGSVFAFQGLTEVGRRWFEENTVSEPWQWLGGVLAVDSRYARQLAEAAVNDGLVVS